MATASMKWMGCFFLCTAIVPATPVQQGWPRSSKLPAPRRRTPPRRVPSASSSPSSSRAPPR
eukprot:4728015-Lingulodinium_polyedra.AAC.1